MSSKPLSQPTNRNYYYPHSSEVSYSDPISHCPPQSWALWNTLSWARSRYPQPLLCTHPSTPCPNWDLDVSRECCFMQPFGGSPCSSFALLCCFWIISSSFSFKEPHFFEDHVVKLYHPPLFPSIIHQPLTYPFSFIKAINTGLVFFFISTPVTVFGDFSNQVDNPLLFNFTLLQWSFSPLHLNQSNLHIILTLTSSFIISPLKSPF